METHPKKWHAAIFWSACLQSGTTEGENSFLVLLGYWKGSQVCAENYFSLLCPYV